MGNSGCVSMGSVGSSEPMEFLRRVPEPMDFEQILSNFNETRRLKYISILKSSYWSVRLFVCLFVILCVRPRKKKFFLRLTYLILILKPVSKHKEYICILFVQMN